MRTAHFVFLVCFLSPWLRDVVGFISGDVFSTLDPRLEDVFCVDAPRLPALGEITTTHEKIITYGVKRAVIDFFYDMDPLFSGTFSPEDTLSETYQKFYGNCSSPQKFLSAVQELMKAASNLDTIPGIRDDPRYGFSSEQFDGSQKVLLENYRKIVLAVTSNRNFHTARKLLGQSLSMISMFYAHSNWVELNELNEDILEGLGQPWFTFTNLAGPAEATCSSSNGSVLVTTKLTTGYESTPMPSGKCRHGGSKDIEKEGISKGTPSCFSPHPGRHEKAGLLAKKHTKYYLNHLWEVFGNHNFSQLLDLSPGSPLVVVIDTTGSMGPYIDAVKSNVRSIVKNDLDKVLPSTYILSEYNDPGVGPLFRTEDPEEFLARVESISPSGGGDLPELYWAGLQAALLVAPSYSDVYTFTDAVGKDGNLMDSVYSLALEKKARISLISSLVPSSRFVTTYEDYKELVELTGGQLVRVERDSIENITSLLSKAIETSKASILKYSGLSGENSFDFPIDNFWTRDSSSIIEIKITGQISEFSVNYDGVKIDFMTDLSGTVYINVPGLLYFAFKPHQSGKWTIDINGVSSYDLSIEATCTFSFSSDFRSLVVPVTHPAFYIIPGQPIIGSLPTIRTYMIGLQRHFISNISSIALIDDQGSVIQRYQKIKTNVEDTFLIDLLTSSQPPLPSKKFLLRLEGEDDEGYPFWRQYPAPFTPSSVQVKITADGFDVVGYPGDTKEIEFNVTSYAEYAEIEVNVVDTLGYAVFS